MEEVEKSIASCNGGGFTLNFNSHEKIPVKNPCVWIKSFLYRQLLQSLLCSRKTLLSVPKACEKKYKTFLFHGRAGKSSYISYFPISWWKYRERLRGLDHVRAQNSVTKNVLSSYFLSIFWYGVTNELWCYLPGIDTIQRSEKFSHWSWVHARTYLWMGLNRFNGLVVSGISPVSKSSVLIRSMQ